MGRLLPQLSRSAAPMSEADVERFLSQSSVHLFVFRAETADAARARLQHTANTLPEQQHLPVVYWAMGQLVCFVPAQMDLPLEDSRLAGL